MTAIPHETPPAGYRLLYADQSCRCLKLWQSGSEKWCCGGFETYQLPRKDAPAMSELLPCAYHVRPDDSIYVVFGSVDGGPHCQADCDLPEKYVKMLVDAYNAQRVTRAAAEGDVEESVHTAVDQWRLSRGYYIAIPDQLDLERRLKAALAARRGKEG